MSEPEDFSISAVQKKRAQADLLKICAPAIAPPPAPRTAKPAPAAATADEGFKLPFDPARLLAALFQNWKWLPLVGAALALPVLLIGLFKFETGYSVTVQLIRREVTTTIRATQFGDAFKPRQVTVQTVVNVMQSLKLLDEAGAQARPPVSGLALAKMLTIKPEKDTDLITVTLKDKGSAPATADLVNLYTKAVVALTAQMQADEAAELDKFLRDQISRVDVELDSVNKELADFSRENQFYGEDREVEAYLHELSDAEVQIQTARADEQTVEFRLGDVERELAQQNPLATKLNQARSDLNVLRASDTDENPVVKDALDKVEMLEKQVVASAGQNTNAGTSFQYSDNTVANELYLQLVSLRSQRQGLVKQFAQLNDFRDRIEEKLKGVPEKSQQHAQIMARLQALQATRDLLSGRQHEAQIYAENSPGLYRQFATASAESVETSSRWKKIITIVIGAFVFGVLGAITWLCGRELLDLRIVSAGDLARATGVPVVARLPEAFSLATVELAQWRFRVWARLLRQLQLQNEPRVTLAFASANVGEGKSTLIGHLRDAAHDRRLPVVTVTNAKTVVENGRRLSLAEAVATPDLVNRHLQEQPGVPLELHFDAAWTWTLENRSHWSRAAEVWAKNESLILLVELPAMNELDAVLAAELMPRVIWVTASGGLEQSELAQTLEMVEAGEVALVAAVLNREPAVFSQLGFLGKFGLALLLTFCFLPAGLNAQNMTNALVASGGLSASSQTPILADWQQRLTVGPGDQFDLEVFARDGSQRQAVAVGPDGRISFLEAQSVLVTGLTVDEMRAALDRELSRYYKNARTIVKPVGWHSKKYYLLGAVVDRGAYPLDRPLTIIEAVARARGVDTGLYEHNTVEIADMTRAFIVRDGRHLPVDFEKLFNHGDLSQNILIAPGDYLYFPSGTVNEVYLLGAVPTPGPLGLTTEQTLMGVLAVRGGFLPTAFKQRVLVVRGSLQKPQAFAVNVAAILAGKEKDFVLQPKDIIYVADKPWQRAADLLDIALHSFVQATVATWTGNYVPTMINTTLLPKP